MTLYNSLTEYDDTIAKVSKPISGLLGISMDGSRVVQHATRNGFVYVRLRDSLSEVVQAYNDKVSPVYDLPVLIERKGNRWYVVGRDTERYSNWGTSAPFLPKHGGQHSFNRDAGTGGDIVPIYPDQFMPALVYPSGTIGAANLIVAPYLLQRNSDFVFVGNTGTQPLTIYKPTNNQARMGLVALNRITGNPEILINSGTSFSASVTGTAGVAPYIPYPSPTQEPLYAFRLVSGTVAITWSNLYNVRQFFRQIQTGSAGGGVSLAFQDEGVPLGTPGTVNFVGDNVSVTVSGTVARVYVTGSSGGGVPTFISGSVPYSGGDGVLKENNPEFKYREDYKQLLLGKEIPLLSSAGNQIKSALVGDQDTTITKALVAFGTGTSGSPSPSFNGYRARGTHDVPLPVKMDDALLNWIGAGFDGGSWINSVRIRAYADGNWITGAHTPSRVEIEITPSGTTTRSLAMTIGSDGNVNIASGKEYRVNGENHTHNMREVLTANRTYYVRTDGSDSNNGLANTAGGAFLTIQKAVNVVTGLDISTYDVTIQVGNGTYTGAVILKSIIGAGTVTIIGDTTTPSNVIISTTSNNCFYANGIVGNWYLKGMRLKTTTSGHCIMAVGTTVTIYFEYLDFNTCADAHIFCQNGAYIEATGNYSITGGATYHWDIITGVLQIATSTGTNTITLTGTPAFSTAFCLCIRVGYVRCNATTFSGSATGTRYNVNANGVIFTNGGGASFLPGNAAGSTATGGQYI